MAVKAKEGEKLAHERLQSARPVRAKTRKRTTAPDNIQGLL